MLQNIGGTGEILLFIFILVMHIHNKILLDLYMLNKAVLTRQKTTAQAAKLGQVSDENLVSKKSKFDTETYSYFGAMFFRYFPFCARKGHRFKQYQRNMATLKGRMDVRNVVLFEGYSMAVINALLEPY